MKAHYQDALTKSGHKHQVKYNPSNPSNANRRKRGRKIIWFNPPFSRSVVTNVGKQFLRLLDIHFPRHNPLHKIFNRSNVKVSYGCMPNIQAGINSHNKKSYKKKSRWPAESATAVTIRTNAHFPKSARRQISCTRPPFLRQ